MGAIRGSSYYEIVVSRSWTEAEEKAQQLGGSLVSIGSHQENQFLANGPFSYEALGRYNEFWIGLNDLNGSWSWSSGDTYDYSSTFIKDEPSWMRWSAAAIRVANTNRYGQDVTPLRATWRDLPANYPAQYEYVEAGIAEIPLSYFSISDSEIEEGEKGKKKGKSC